MKFVAGGVTASELSAFQAGLAYIKDKEFLHTKIENTERNEHVRFQASLRHAISLDVPAHIAYIIVTCTLGESSGSKRKMCPEEDPPVTWTVVDVHTSDAAAEAPQLTEPRT